MPLLTRNDLKFTIRSSPCILIASFFCSLLLSSSLLAQAKFEIKNRDLAKVGTPPDAYYVTYRFAFDGLIAMKVWSHLSPEDRRALLLEISRDVGQGQGKQITITESGKPTVVFRLDWDSKDRPRYLYLYTNYDIPTTKFVNLDSDSTENTYKRKYTLYDTKLVLEKDDLNREETFTKEHVLTKKEKWQDLAHSRIHDAETKNDASIPILLNRADEQANAVTFKAVIGLTRLEYGILRQERLTTTVTRKQIPELLKQLHDPREKRILTHAFEVLDTIASLYRGLEP